MKTPNDIHISEKDCRFTDCKLPADAVLYGFTVDFDGDKLNAIIKDKLSDLEGRSPDEIILDGEIQRLNSKDDALHLEKRLQTPFATFVAAFEKKIDLVVNRLQRMYELQNVTAWRSLDWLTYRDMVIVQVAAMSVDVQANKRGGYTIQSLLERIGQPQLIVELDKVLDKAIAVDAHHNTVSVRAALKIVRDKFLCHYDNHESYDLYGKDKETFWSLADMFVLEQLLLPPVFNELGPIGAVRELVLAICKTFMCATANAKWKMFVDALASDRSDDKH